MCDKLKFVFKLMTLSILVFVSYGEGLTYNDTYLRQQPAVLSREPPKGGIFLFIFLSLFLSMFVNYTSTNSWRGYIFTAVCLCVRLSVCLSVCVSIVFL